MSNGEEAAGHINAANKQRNNGHELIRSPRQLKLGGLLLGGGDDQSAWRDGGLPSNASSDVNWFISQARLAEEAKFDFVFVPDTPFVTPETHPFYLDRLEPMTLLSAIAVSTSRIGVVGTATTSYWEPYNLARQFSSLDKISNGRAGWNVVTTADPGAARNFGKSAHLDHATRYRRAGEFLNVVRGLWDSYEDDAFIHDRGNRIFFDKLKQHPLDHDGEFFSVAGPLALSRSKQGHPVIFQAGLSGGGRDLGAQTADVLFAGVDAYEDAHEFYVDVKRRAVLAGRDPRLLFIAPGISPVIEDTDEQAFARLNEDRKQLELGPMLARLARAFGGYDFKQHDPDDLFPDLDGLALESFKGIAERIRAHAREHKLSIRQTAFYVATRHRGFIGTPKTIADEIERWFLGEAADAFIVQISRPDDFQRFRERVIPILRERGFFRKEYEGTTLRDNLGLPIPENRWQPDESLREPVHV